MSEHTTVTAEASLEELHGVGSARSEHLPRETVGELANSSAQQIANEMDGEMSSGEIEEVVETARESLDEYDGRVTAKVYTKSDDDEGDGGTVTVESQSFDDVDDFLDNVDDGAEPFTPEECESVALLGGDGVFDPDGLHSSFEAKDQAALVESKLNEFGFEPDEIVVPGSGMGVVAVKSWVALKRDQGEPIPNLRVISVEASGGYPSGDDYRERNNKILEAVDGVCAFANGDYVGMWVNMVNERDDVIVRTPEQRDDE